MKLQPDWRIICERRNVAVDPAYLWPDLVTAYSARTNLAAIKELISAAATVMRVPAHSRLYDPGIACLFSFARGLEKYFARQSGSYFRCQK